MIPWDQLIKLALGAATLLGEAVTAIMSYTNKSDEEKAKVLASLRTRAQLDNAAVQGVKVYDTPPEA